MANVGALVVELAASTARFQSDLGKAAVLAETAARRVDRAFSDIKDVTLPKSITSALSVGGILLYTNNVIGAAEALSELSDRSGVAVETLAGLEFAAQQTGGSTEAFANALKFLNKNIADAGSGNKELQGLFQKLGLDDAARGADSAEEALLKLAEVFPRLNGAQQTLVSMKLLGKSGEELKPALAGGRQALEDLINEGKRLNPVTADLAKQADQFNDNLAKLSATLKSNLLPVLNEIVPRLNDFFEIGEKLNNKGGIAGALVGNIAVSDAELAEPGKALAKVNAEIERIDKNFEKITGASFARGVQEAKKAVLLAEQSKQALALAAGLGPDREGRGRAITGGPVNLATDDKGKTTDKYAAARKRTEDFLADLDKERLGIEASVAQKKMLEAAQLATALASDKEKSAFLAKAAILAQGLEDDQRRAEMEKEFQKILEDSAAKQQKALDDMVQKERDLLEEQLHANEIFGLNEEQIINLTIAKKEAALASAEAEKLTREETDALREQINILGQRAKAANESEQLKQDKKARDDEQKAYEDMWASIDSAARDAFHNIGQNGESAAERISKALEEGVYDLLYQMTIKKWIVDIQANLSGDGSSGGGWWGAIASAVGSYYGGGGDASSLELYAKGGVMSKYGNVPLRRYASGGVASSPQMAIYGEGSMNEAFVPLPDGRSIPVTMSGGGSVIVNQNINIDSRSDMSSIREAMEVAKREAVTEVSRQISRNGPMAKAVRNA